MSSINNLANYGYYQLNTNSNSAGSQSNNASNAIGSTQSLINALNGTSNSTSGNNNAYLLNLSPAAKQYLSANSSVTPASASTGTNATQTYTLNAKQQHTIADILAKYKDAPYTQDTFIKIQNDLNAAGLGTSTLSMVDKSKSFNAAQVLINALSGGAGGNANSGVASDADEQAKAGNYIKGIISQWKNLSSTADDAKSDSKGNAAAVTAVSTTGEA